MMRSIIFNVFSHVIAHTRFNVYVLYHMLLCTCCAFVYLHRLSRDTSISVFGPHIWRPPVLCDYLLMCAYIFYRYMSMLCLGHVTTSCHVYFLVTLFSPSTKAFIVSYLSSIDTSMYLLYASLAQSPIFLIISPSMLHW